MSVHVHWPLPIESHARLRVDLLYAPALHNGLATIGDRSIAQPGLLWSACWAGVSGRSTKRFWSGMAV